MLFLLMFLQQWEREREWLDVKSKTLNLSSLSLGVFSGRGCQHLDELLAIDAVLVINCHFSESFVALLAAEFLTPGHKGVSQVISLNVAIFIRERLEGSNDDFIVIRAWNCNYIWILLNGDSAFIYWLIITSRLPLGEHGQQHGEVDGSGSVTKHLIQLLLRCDATQFVVGGTQVVLAKDTILVSVHQLETFLEFSHLLLAKHREDVTARALGGLLLGTTTWTRFGRGGSSRFRGRSGSSISCWFGLFLLLLLLLISISLKYEKRGNKNGIRSIHP